MTDLRTTGRSYGKRTAALAEFYARGVAGQAIVYSNPQGDFLSPKAAANLITRTREEVLIEVQQVVEQVIQDERYSGAPHALNEVIKRLQALKDTV